jgi:hypothetical protein
MGNSREPPAFKFSGLLRDATKNHVVTKRALKRLPSKVPTAFGPASEAALHDLGLAKKIM